MRRFDVRWFEIWPQYENNPPENEVTTMRSDSNNESNRGFISTIAASRWCWQRASILLLSIIPLTGCLGEKFEHDFSSAKIQPSRSTAPLVGAWEGSWQSTAQGGDHVARAVVTLNSQNKYEISLELVDFEPQPGVSNFPFDKYWIELRDVSLATTSGQTEQFQTKTRLRKAYKSNLIAEAMTLQGSIQRDTLQIQFSTNDALNELDQGRIDLQRATPAHGRDVK
jgi:hypothetical protein